MSETPSPDSRKEEARLRALYQADQNGISPVAQMQDNLNKLVSIAATASVIAFALHHKNTNVNLGSFEKQLFSNRESGWIANLKKKTIKDTIHAILQETYLGKGSETPLHDYFGFVATVPSGSTGKSYDFVEEEEKPSYQTGLPNSPITPDVMQKSLGYLNQILQGHLKLMVAPGEGYKKLDTALNKFRGEKEGRLDEMKDLARIMVVFKDSKLSDIFSYALYAVADYVQHLEENPFQCSPCPLPPWSQILPNISPKLKLEFLAKGIIRPSPCKQEERCQDSAYYTEYAHIVLFGQPVEIQICQERMAAVYDVTHDIYAVKRILDEIKGIFNQIEACGFSAESKSSKLQLELEKEEKLKEMARALMLANVSLDSFSRPLGEVSHPVLGQEEVGRFQKIMHSVMNVFVKSPVAETFNEKRRMFEADAALVLGDSYRAWLDGLCDIHSKHLSTTQKKHLAGTIKEIFGITEEVQMSSDFLMDKIDKKYDLENLRQDRVFAFQNDLMSKISETGGEYVPILEKNRLTSPPIAAQKVRVARLDDEIRDLRQLCHAVSVYGWPTDPEYRRRFAEAIVAKFSDMVNPNKQMKFNNSKTTEKQPKVNHFLRDLLAKWGVIPARITQNPVMGFITGLIGSQGR